ncbi:MAG: VWA domain-containing protein, partial [Alphaproteobacteria bacterium]|nr:VWA domain-containing protein [Alphaproteobacteria bacterium]
RGSVLPIVGMSLVALVGLSGMAVDMGRVQMVQSKLSSSLDAAGLAAGATVNTATVSTEVNKYFNANYPAGYLGSTVTAVNSTVSSDNMTISLSATATVPTTFMRVVGITTVTVTANSQITRSSKGMELVLVLDNTGSMNDPVNSSNSSVSKISALKTAAATLVNNFYGSNTTVPNLWIGIVPFTQAVNIGTSYTGRMDTTYDATINWTPTSWMGCVMARSAPYDTSDDPPSVKLFQQYFFPSSSPYNVWKTTTTSHGHTTTTYASPLDSTHQGPNLYCPQQVTPMTATKSTILNNINAMIAGGDTDIDLGMVWGWRMISPRWRGLWGGEMNTNSLPLDYNTPKMNKVVILMTDGVNHYTPGNYTAYGFLSDGQLGTTNESTAENTLNSRTLALCTAMKQQGIIIYTIGFGSSSDVDTTLLQSCATQNSYFFLSPTNADLDNAFKAIGDSLANLRVSQ